jgi:hypothetical protein
MVKNKEGMYPTFAEQAQLEVEAGHLVGGKKKKEGWMVEEAIRQGGRIVKKEKMPRIVL